MNTASAGASPLVSIGLPVYNGERYLRQALDSIKAQTFADYEVVISDNASTDGTAAICRGYAAADARFLYFRNAENIGGSPNHNRVVELSRGKYFVWASYDDLRHPEYVRRCVEALEADPALVICHSRTAYIDEEGKELPVRETVLDVSAELPSARFRDLIRMDHQVEPILGLIRNDVLKKTGLEGQYADCDRVLLAELGLYGPFRILPEALFYRREHPMQSAKVYGVSRQDRTAWFDPRGAGKVVFPHLRQFREYLACISRVPLAPLERLRCRASMARWVWVNRKRLLSDLTYLKYYLVRATIRRRRPSSTLAGMALLFAALGLQTAQGAARPAAAGPLKACAENGRYFCDPKGNAVLLAGAHTWTNLQDAGVADPPPALDYGQYLAYLSARGNNFFRLWTWEAARWSCETDLDYHFDPMPYQRTGPGNALDGKPKFDLTLFNQAYFDRMRQRVQQAGTLGFYVSVMLFDGWSIEMKGFGRKNPWDGHPYNRANNINGIDGDANGDGEGKEVHTLANAKAVAAQEGYLRRVVDAVKDLPNVLYEVSNESPSGSKEWQYHVIRFVKEYETSLGVSHPVGMTAEYPNGSNQVLWDSPADWVSPNGYDQPYKDTPPAADGKKVVIVDTDHLWGVGGDATWVWKTFARGNNMLFMDPYYPDQPGFSVGADFEKENYVWAGLRKALGQTVDFSRRIDLSKVKPSAQLSNTGYCLANPGVEYLVYAPDGGPVTLQMEAGAYDVEWFNPHDDSRSTGTITVSAGQHGFSWPAHVPYDGVLLIRKQGLTPVKPGGRSRKGKTLPAGSRRQGAAMDAAGKVRPNPKKAGHEAILFEPSPRRS